AAATAERYASVYEAYAARAKADEPLVWMGHAHIRGGRPTDSERDLVRGAEEALPPSIFGDSFAYAALGHLHLAQEVEGADGPIRYAGSPIPLSLAETTYPHQVLRVDLEDGRARVASLLVPRHVDLIRFGQDDPKGPDETLAALQAEAFDGSLPRERWPFIEVSVFLEEPAVDLAERILGVLANKPVRFLRIDSRRAASMRTRLGDRVFDRDLSDLDPEEVLTEFHRAERGAEPSEALLQAFRELQAGVLACES
ncbi:MAG: exonuclease SbcCD subunit D C-terminal domain-containing protein, partial [Myxococcota bacterium]